MMNTGLPRSAASEVLPPVTVGPAIAGAGGRVAAEAVATATSAPTRQAKARRRAILSIYLRAAFPPGRSALSKCLDLRALVASAGVRRAVDPDGHEPLARALKRAPASPIQRE